jgi:adenosylhomocysteine nucleosidase
MKIAIIAAMEREVAQLVRNWKVREISHDGRRYRLYESGDAALVCSGIGPEQGRRAAEALIQEVRPARIMSVGFTGGLDASLKVGDIVEPNIVVNGADGSRTNTGRGSGILVSSAAVVDRDQKSRLAKAYGAIAVDMEGAAVAMAAQAHGVGFAALKAISDELDFAMPPVNSFVSARGEFRSARFAVHVALRPWLWGRTIALAWNSVRASRSLCSAIEAYLKTQHLI